MSLHQFNNYKSGILAWWPIILGVLTLYIPTFYGLANGIWTNEEQAHGPIILILSIWLIFRKWKTMIEESDDQSTSVLGWLVLIVALIFYVVGSSQQILILEIGSFILALTAILLIKRGYAALKIMWFPLFFLLFMIPLPGSVVSFFTMPMKMAVSYVAENILFWANYPIARNGVILQIGQYQLLVADACAGLQTLLTLEALGLFYLNLINHTSVFRNVTLAILIIPISFTANVIRVIVLTLITYHYGDAAGQGFLHGFAGMVLFISALVLILGVDGLLQYFARVQPVNVIHPVRNV
ncbi:exosortase B [Nitrosomonas supralitoralis]|uniref:Exosortase B n=1 Tax=Nitrosomonas supralitoralis TaxID=2116706 RepID=A0A2P7NSL9_9PROT|nr:exosortase B [Nitrosomonas supralitoralis]PSJ16445.1 exosortase B [Nitrosomonas supralitoralis]